MQSENHLQAEEEGSYSRQNTGWLLQGYCPLGNSGGYLADYLLVLIRRFLWTGLRFIYEKAQTVIISVCDCLSVAT